MFFGSCLEVRLGLGMVEGSLYFILVDFVIIVEDSLSELEKGTILHSFAVLEM
jgi:hypothetical protein